MSIPKNAKKVFQGNIFSVYQWRQTMFDGSYKIFERAQRQDSVVIIATVKNKIVLLKQMQPGTKWFYCTPSGRMDIPGEKPEVAAKRELLEETGMVAGKFFLWKKITSEGKVTSTIYFYIARDCKVISPQKLDNGEKIKVNYVSFEDYLKLSDDPTNHIGESITDMFKARLDKKYKTYLKKIIFG
jgi:ADP-ribose pyrophosphatase